MSGPDLGYTLKRLWDILLQCSDLDVAWRCPSLLSGKRWEEVWRTASALMDEMVLQSWLHTGTNGWDRNNVYRLPIIVGKNGEKCRRSGRCRTLDFSVVERAHHFPEERYQ